MHEDADQYGRLTLLPATAVSDAYFSTKRRQAARMRGFKQLRFQLQLE